MKQLKALVTGSHGMLGSEVVRALTEVSIPRDSSDYHGDGRGFVFNAYSHKALDITDAGHVRAVLRDDRPDVVINCAGLTKHHDTMPSDVDMRRVNSLGPLLLARSCAAVGARLIHVSTDCVFSGKRPLDDGPYTEADKPDATDVYGESKAFGEVRGAPHLTVRCSFIGWGGGLLEWLAGPHELPVPLWMEAQWSGSTAPVIARALVELAQKPEVTGLMHLVRGDYLSKGHLIEWIWKAGLARSVSSVGVHEPLINRWLRSNRDDVPVLPPLIDALRELRRG